MFIVNLFLTRVSVRFPESGHLLFELRDLHRRFTLVPLEDEAGDRFEDIPSHNRVDRGQWFGAPEFRYRNRSGLPELLGLALEQSREPPQSVLIDGPVEAVAAVWTTARCRFQGGRYVGNEARRHVGVLEVEVAVVDGLGSADLDLFCDGGQGSVCEVW